MHSIQRFLLAATAAGAFSGAMAQQPYTIVVTGQVTPCGPNTIVTVQTYQQTPVTITAQVDSNCTYFVAYTTWDQWSYVTASTLCNGQIVTEGDTALFTFLPDTIYMVLDLNCGGGGVYDCLQILNGPNMPGTPCNDNDPNTINDTWSANCVCQGTAPFLCQAAFTVQQAMSGGNPVPWSVNFVNQSTGQAPISYLWSLPNGSTSGALNPSFTFTAPGVYGACLTITAGNCTSTMCDTIVVDSLGMINNGPVWFDCLGVLWGTNVPGSPCDDGNPNTINDTWTPNCSCVGQGNGTIDCLGIPGGPNMPGTACTDTAFGGIFTGTWSANCVCIINGIPDCLGILNGPNQPGTPCNDNNPLTVNDTWDANCVCAGSTPTPCEADFWVMQAYTIDSLNPNGSGVPVPYELWIWNLSSGGSGAYSFVWDFGDGTTSTAAFPTHIYGGSGPYLLCLTIDDGLGCVDTYCDTVSVDANGIYSGMAPGNDDRSVLTINVIQQLPSGIQEPEPFTGLVAWPNPTAAELNVSFTSTLSGRVPYAVIDQNGKLAQSGWFTLVNGSNQVAVPAGELVPGMYLLRIGEGRHILNQRFVRNR